MAQAERREYVVAAIVLHWTIAIAMFGQIALGWWMGDALHDPTTQAKAIEAFQLHKSIGLTVLALSLVRLGLRVLYPPPAPPAHMPAWEKRVAMATHWIFYTLMIGLPLTGWLYVSTGWSAPENRALEVPTLLFGLVQVPHLFGLSHLSEQTRATLASVFEFSHSKMAWVVIALTALHVGAALKHHFMDQDDVLSRMAPGVKPRDPAYGVSRSRARTFWLAGGFALMSAGLAGAIFAFAIAGAPVAPAPSALVETAMPEAPPAALEPQSRETQTGQPAPAAAAPADPSAPWVVNYHTSEIAFTGSHAGTPFRGTFSRWRAEIVFDPDNLEDARVTATIETASASDGVPLHDTTLPQAEWFDTAQYPTATFRADQFRQTGDGAYEARGQLTLKNRTQDVALPFRLTIANDRAEMSGEIALDRAAFDLGQRSDPDGEFVSTSIGVSVRVRASRP